MRPPRLLGKSTGNSKDRVINPNMTILCHLSAMNIAYKRIQSTNPFQPNHKVTPMVGRKPESCFVSCTFHFDESLLLPLLLCCSIAVLPLVAVIYSLVSIAIILLQCFNWWYLVGFFSFCGRFGWLAWVAQGCALSLLKSKLLPLFFLGGIEHYT